MQKKYIAGIVGLALVAILAFNLVAAGSFGKGLNNLAPSEEEHEAIRTAMQNGDYSTWKSLMEQRVENIKASLTEENFNQMVQAHQERLAEGFQGRNRHSGMGKGMKGQGQFSGDCPYAD